MQYEVDTPDAYLRALDDDWRKDSLEALRTLILQQDNAIEERIHYKMLGYYFGGQYVFHLNAQRGYVSLYVGNTTDIDPEGELLAGLNLGKGCIRFTKTKRVPETRIEEFIGRAVSMARRGKALDC
ncbi:iron chaperone [Saccharospirillum salsuginis]|uniref:YdhG-like domain-containing protein n=1 Tax=Saccharospirillum salsuginis TaxID=418750 RepID=A0A918K174_9GAMM|nr:DUF1801 domain-containing protein [Saccharospirillum salsuginis]GGX42723.1 hypothetical protein GCM10007392_06630 [Saccharospirillum salsuginis]